MSEVSEFMDRLPRDQGSQTLDRHDSEPRSHRDAGSQARHHETAKGETHSQASQRNKKALADIQAVIADLNSRLARYVHGQDTVGTTAPQTDREALSWMCQTLADVAATVVGISHARTRHGRALDGFSPQRVASATAYTFLAESRLTAGHGTMTVCPGQPHHPNTARALFGARDNHRGQPGTALDLPAAVPSGPPALRPYNVDERPKLNTEGRSKKMTTAVPNMWSRSVRNAPNATNNRRPTHRALWRTRRTRGVDGGRQSGVADRSSQPSRGHR